MCSVFGFLKFGELANDKDLKVIHARFSVLSKKAEMRGRDSWGCYLLNKSGKYSCYKGIGKISEANIEEFKIMPDITMIIGNTRAEPTTEFIPIKTENDIQPFVSERFIVSHNGTIANDRELCRTFQLQPSSRIDSAVLPLLFEKIGIDKGISELIGSYTIVGVDLTKPRELHLIRNYKPIAYIYDSALDALWFASDPNWLESYVTCCKPDQFHPVIPDPYTHIIINGATRDMSIKSIGKISKKARQKILVVASGGLDSTVVATLLKQQGHEVHLFHVDYGCHATEMEKKAILAIADYLGVKVTVMKNDWLGSIGGSSLTVANSSIAEGMKGAEFPHEWVPARNMLMIASACAFSDVHGFDAIALGTNLEEGGAYPDNTEEFIKIMDLASRLGTISRACIISPIGNLMKHEIVKLGLEINAPLHLTWSCYKNGLHHCGDCGPCYMRKRAFQMIGEDDPIRYSEFLSN
jgi:7-cyano-7-deazaguanine synthase